MMLPITTPTFARIATRLICSLFAVSSVLPSAFGEFTFTAGHGDIGVAYDGGLELHWHLGDGAPAIVDGLPVNDQEYGPDEIKAVVPGVSNFNRPAGAAFNFIGNAAGELTYYLPESETPGVPYLGLATEELSPGDWTTPITWTINSVTGSGVTAGGQFSIFQDLSSPTVFASTFSGLLNFNTPIGGHTHFNYGFTQPGVYDVAFTVSGTHILDGPQLDSGTFRFDVTAVPEPTSIGGALVLAGTWVMRRRRPARNVR